MCVGSLAGVLVMLVSPNVFHVVSALQSIVFIRWCTGGASQKWCKATLWKGGYPSLWADVMERGIPPCILPGDGDHIFLFMATEMVFVIIHTL